MLFILSQQCLVLTYSVFTYKYVYLQCVVLKRTEEQKGVFQLCLGEYRKYKTNLLERGW